jgi:hypothetical protein
MKLRFAVSALTVLAFAAGAPALALAQTPGSPSGNVEASTPVPNPPAKSTHKAHHAKAKTSHHKAATTKAAK